MALQTFEFDDDSDIDVVLDDETITLHYEEDLDDLATVSTDRAGAPEGGQVHVTVSDFRLNLNPIGEDVWIMHTNGTLASYVTATDDTNDDNWVETFGGLGGKLTVTENDEIVTVADGSVTLTETGANTGVFESQNGDDLSGITVTGDENDDFTIAYADGDVQVFIESFDSTLVVIADGTWDSGETATVRLSNENLNLNTLIGDDFAIDDDDLPVLIQGDPITLGTVDMAINDRQIGESISVNDAHVATLSATHLETTITVELSADQLKRLTNNALSHYAHVSTDLAVTTDAELEGATAPTTIPNGLTAVNVTDDADGTFTVTFTANDDMIEPATITANTAIHETVAAAAAEAVDTESNNVPTAATVKDAAEGADGSAPPEFIAAITAINVTDASIDDVLAAVNKAAEDNINATGFTVVADIFSFGADANDAIYRALLEETDSASGVFEGTIEYQILNQRTVDMSDTHKSVAAIGNELAMILNTGYTGGDAPEFTYDEDNASEDAPTNTGEVSVDASTYRVSDDVTITLVDADLNTDSGAREIYRIVDSSGGTIEPVVVSIAIGDLACARRDKRRLTA